MSTHPALHPEDPAEALSRVEPDLPDPESVDWAADALLAGRSLPDVLTDLLDRGWDPAVAEASVEAARVRTRDRRGVVTRSDVVRLSGRSRPSTSPLSTLCRGVGLLGFAGGLRAALATARHLGRVARPDHPIDPAP